VDADYIVVGTGSAGSVMANRLSTDPSAQVVVLEAGPQDKDKFIHIPAAFAKLFRSDMDWDYFTEPQKELDGREIYWPRGKVLGGSSSMNAMVWARGFAADYDEWAERRRGVELRPRREVLQPHRTRALSHLSAAQPAVVNCGMAARGL
jgi:choline dehydrogenase